MFDALVSLCFNIGAGNFAKSHLLSLINQVEFETSIKSFSGWGNDDRRSAEREIYTRGVKKYLAYMNRKGASNTSSRSYRSQTRLYALKKISQK
jgi:hypothetical protein